MVVTAVVRTASEDAEEVMEVHTQPEQEKPPLQGKPVSHCSPASIFPLPQSGAEDELAPPGGGSAGAVEDEEDDDGSGTPEQSK
jgi:hypothetical protein